MARAKTTTPAPLQLAIVEPRPRKVPRFSVPPPVELIELGKRLSGEG